MKASVLSALALTSVAAENCGIPVELVIVQDLTSFSWKDGETSHTLNPYKDMTGRALVVMSSYLAEYNEGSRVGLVTFRDKPFPNYGGDGDYCARVDGPLVDIADVSQILSLLSGSVQTGGGDAPDANYYGIWYSAVHPSVEWTPLNYDPTRGRNDRVRAVIQVTNTIGWVAGNGDVAACNDTRCDDILPHHGEFEPGKEDEDCETMFYPPHDTIRKALVDKQIHFGTLLIRPDFYDVEPEDDLTADAWRWSFDQFYPGEYPPGSFPEDDDRLIRLRVAPKGSTQINPTAFDDVSRDMSRILEALIGDACDTYGVSTEEDISSSSSPTSSEGDVEPTSDSDGEPTSEGDGEPTSDSDGNGAGPSSSTTSTNSPPFGATSTVTTINEEGAPIGLIVGVTVGGAAAVAVVAGAVTKWGMRPAETRHFEELESN